MTEFMLIFWTVAIATVTAVACSLCGVYLVIKREAFVSEGLSHAVLPGIVVAFLFLQDRSSPLLIVTAGLSGLLMVWLVQAIFKTRLVDQDAALGIVFSGLFSVGVLLSSLELKNVHFHAECIIDGDLAYAPLKQVEILGWMVPKALAVMSAVLAVLIGFVVVFYKELKLMSFDETASKMLGFRPRLMHTLWLGLVSITAVAAFQVAGTVLVVALMIAPPVAANLWTNRLGWMLVASSLIGAMAAGGGVALGMGLNTAYAGPIASMAGLLFLLSLFLAPKQGLFSKWRLRKRQTVEMLSRLVIEKLSVEQSGQSKKSLLESVYCEPQQFKSAVALCQRQTWIESDGDRLKLTEKGRRILES